MANPGKSLDIALESSFEFGGFTIYPLTLGHSIVLEKIKSPLMVGVQHLENATELIPTMFVMTRPATESMKLLQKGQEAFDYAVVEWSSNLTYSTMFDLVEAIAKTGENLLELNKLSSKSNGSDFQMEVMGTGQSSPQSQRKDSVGLFHKLWKRR